MNSHQDKSKFRTKNQHRALQRSRKGTIVVLTAVLLIPLLAMVAFCVDMGYCIKVTSELQTAADSAALAGASQLLTPQFGTINNARATSDALTAATEASRFSQLNSGGGVSLALRDADVVIGTKAGSTVTPWSSGRPYPDSVQIVVRRDGSANGMVPLYFARALGLQNWSGQMTATASFAAGAYSVQGFNSYPGGPNAQLLPIAVDYNLWTAFMNSGASPDGNVYDEYKYVRETSSLSAPHNVSNVADNIPEFHDVYPNATAPGNFGLLSIGPPATDTGSYHQWIDEGATPSDLAYFGVNGLVASLEAPATVKGGPGMKSALQSSFQQIIGKPRILPLYSSYSGNGSNTYYQIVAFAGVTFVKAEGRGSNMDFVIQPCIVIDSTTQSDPSLASSSTGVYPTSPLRLTQ